MKISQRWRKYSAVAFMDFSHDRSLSPVNYLASRGLLAVHWILH